MFFFVVMEQHRWTDFVSNSGKYLLKHIKYLKMFMEMKLFSHTHVLEWFERFRVGHEDRKNDQGMDGHYLFEILVCKNW
jgi:hypothetical protein